MATLAQIVADVIVITNRPDLVAETNLAVKVATLKCHSIDVFPMDMYELGISFAIPAYVQSVEFRTLVPRWRQFKYLRKFNTNGVNAQTGLGGASTPIVMITPELSINEYGQDRENVCYMAGESLQIRSSTQDANMLLGCYIYPDVTDATYKSWIADSQPYAIVFEAASKIFKSIGQDEQNVMMSKEAAEQMMLVRNANVLGQGY